MELFNSEENFTHKTYDWKKYLDSDMALNRHHIEAVNNSINYCCIINYLNKFLHKKAYDFENKVIYHFDVTYDEYINYILSHQLIKSQKYYQLILDTISNEVQCPSLYYYMMCIRSINIEGNYVVKFQKDINWNLIFELSKRKNVIFMENIQEIYKKWLNTYGQESNENANVIFSVNQEYNIHDNNALQNKIDELTLENQRLTNLNKEYENKINDLNNRINSILDMTIDLYYKNKA